MVVDGRGDGSEEWLEGSKAKQQTPYLGGLTSGAPDLEGKNRKKG